MAEPNTKRARWFLRIFGGFFVVIAFFLSVYHPENNPEHAVLICGGIGATLTLIGQFGSPKIVGLFEKLLTGWP